MRSHESFKEVLLLPVIRKYSTGLEMAGMYSGACCVDAQVNEVKSPLYEIVLTLENCLSLMK